MLGLMVILLVIMVSNTFVHYLSQAASGSISSSAVLNLISFTVPNFIVVLIPITFFLAIVISFGKLFADNELLVMFSCGLTWKQIVQMGLKTAFFLAICVVMLSFWLVPKMLAYRDALQASAGTPSAMTDIQVGRFILLNNGAQVIYIGQSNKNNTEFQNLFMYEQGAQNTHQDQRQDQKITLAPHAKESYDSDLKQEVLVLDAGEQYKLIPAKQNIQITSFDHYELPVNYASRTSQSQRMSAETTWVLIKDRSFSAMNELIWRASEGVTVFVLLFLGLAICHIAPRKSRYTKLIPAILIFIIYFNLLTISHTWATVGLVPLLINVWWVHILFLGTSALILWRREYFL